MNERERLIERIEALEYRVESYGDLGAERELEGLRAELRAMDGERDRALVELLMVRSRRQAIAA